MQFFINISIVDIRICLHGLLVIFVAIAIGCAPSDNPSSLGSLQQEQIEELENFTYFEGMDQGPISPELEKAKAEYLKEKARREAEQAELIEQLEAIGYLTGSEEATEESVVTFINNAAVYPGPSLYTAGHGTEAILIDIHGKELHKWRCSFEEAFPTREKPTDKDWQPIWRYTHCFNNGDLLAIIEGQGLIKLDRDSNLLWVLEERAHHDLNVMDDGTIYVLTRKAHMAPRISQDRPILEDFITHLDTDGNILEQVSLLEAYENSSFKERIFELTRADGDLFHTNSLFYLDGSQEERSPLLKQGNFLVSMKMSNSLAIVDYTEQKVVWHKEGTWIGQHKALLLDDGNIMLFDNNRFGWESRVLIIEPFVEPLSIVWEYEGAPPDTFYTTACGAAQPLPNGNILVTESENGRAFELTPDQEMVWRFVTPYRPPGNPLLVAYMYEMIRLSSDFPLDWTYDEKGDWPEGWKK